MVKYHLVLKGLFLLLLLASCAQVGTISGGGKDRQAPKPIRMFPENATTSFVGRQIILEFDEFFSLNQAKENIRIIPGDVRIDAQVKKKRLYLRLLDPPSANTTYQIHLNKAVQDISEKNDSLMTYVFSTGSIIDSLSYSGQIRDAYTGKASGKITLALYEEGDSIFSKEARYVSQTDAGGKFTFNYLGAGSYQVIAFRDQNGNLRPDTNEYAGFREETLKLNESVQDSSFLELFPGKQQRIIRHKKFRGPRFIELAGNYDLSKSQFFQAGQKIEQKNVIDYDIDSIGLLLLHPITYQLALQIQAENGEIDSLNLRLPLTEKERVEMKLLWDELVWNEQRQLVFYANQEILSLDSGRIMIDSLKNVTDYVINFEGNRLFLQFKKPIEKTFDIRLDPGAIKYSEGIQEDTLSFSIQAKAPGAYGSVVLNAEDFPEHSILECLQGEKLIRRMTGGQLRAHPRMDYLEPGTYRFRMIVDENDNGRWDPGSLPLRKRSEKVIYFQKEITLRANWETELELELKE